MDVEKIRGVLADIRKEAEQDPKFKEEVLANLPKVMRDRGLNLDEIVEAHEMTRCPAASLAGQWNP